MAGWVLIGCLKVISEKLGNGNKWEVIDLGQILALKKNDELELTIDDLGKDGEGIGHVDGYALFVKEALPGELVRVKVMKTKKGYGFARLMEILRPSPARVPPRCPVARQCGGCTLQHLSYEAQLIFKEKKVMDCLSRIGGIDLNEVCVLPVLGMKEPWNYRNKAQFPVRADKSGNPVIGFYAGRTHSIIPVTDCCIQTPEMQPILECVMRFMREHKISAYNEEAHIGLIRHIFIRCAKATGEIMVCFVLNGNERTFIRQFGTDFIKELREASPSIASILVNVNCERTNVIMGKTTSILWGKESIVDKIGGIQYEISAHSFYQVNPTQTIRLYETALDFAGLTGREIVWDMYCGIGTISLFLAQKASKVFGVEIVPQAIKDARRNARLNGITNTEFFCGAAEDVVGSEQVSSRIGEDAMHADVIVVDPPRKGCDSSLLETIRHMAPKRIVYVSCDPATLARDIKVLGDDASGDRGRYVVEKVRVCDMFPGGGHVETVVLLSQQKPSDRIEVDLDMDEMDVTSAETKATYVDIKDYVLKEHGLKVSNLYISQVKRKCGLEVGENYNLAKSEDAKQPNCPENKEKAIEDALKHFGMIS